MSDNIGDVIGDVVVLDHGDGLVQIGEVAVLHLCLDLAEGLQELASHRGVQTELYLLSQHPGVGLRVDQVVAVARKVLGGSLERVAVPWSAWLVNDLVAVLVQHLRQAAWRTPVKSGAVGQEGGHDGQPVASEHRPAAGRERDPPDLDGLPSMKTSNIKKSSKERSAGRMLHIQLFQSK